MAAHTVHEEITYPTTLRTDDDGDAVVVVTQPITYQPMDPPAHLTALPPKPHQTTSDQLTIDNLSKHDKGFDSLLDAAQKATRALGLQRAGKEQGFHLELQHYTNDRFDL
ncbi:hypothetical protein COCCADRAFT_74299, partial [Bipolaris zeicola 26-R-13]